MGQDGWRRSDAWIFVAVVMANGAGRHMRSATTRRPEGVRLADVLTLDNFKEVFAQPTLLRGIVNTILIGVVGGGVAVACYTAIGLAAHRRNDGWTRFVDYLVLVPRPVPGLLAGLAFLWVFLFFPPFAPLRSTIVSL